MFVFVRSCTSNNLNYECFHILQQRMDGIHAFLLWNFEIEFLSLFQFTKTSLCRKQQLVFTHLRSGWTVLLNRKSVQNSVWKFFKNIQKVQLKFQKFTWKFPIFKIVIASKLKINKHEKNRTLCRHKAFVVGVVVCLDSSL